MDRSYLDGYSTGLTEAIDVLESINDLLAQKDRPFDNQERVYVRNWLTKTIRSMRSKTKNVSK